LKFLDRLKKTIRIKFHENPPCGNRVVPCGETEDGQTHINGRFFATLRTSLKTRKRKLG